MAMNNSLRSKYEKKSLGDAMSVVTLLLPYGFVFFLFVAIPIAVSVMLSLTYFNVIETPRYTGALNYITLLTQDEVFSRYILPNTVKYALIVGPGGYVLSFITAWMLAQVQKLPRTIMALALYTPSMVGPVFITVVWRTLFSGDEAGYINALLIRLELIDKPIQFLLSSEYIMGIMILVSLWGSMGIGFLAMLAGILNVNEELYEAAYMDGLKNRFQEIIYITVPSMKPQMLFGAVMAIVNAFNTGWIGVTLSGSNPTPGYAANVIINHIEDYGFLRYEMGYAAAVSVALLLLVTAFSKVAHTLFAEKD